MFIEWGLSLAEAAASGFFLTDQISATGRTARLNEKAIHSCIGKNKYRSRSAVRQAGGNGRSDNSEGGDEREVQ